ncbi:helix-turn-helix domain-containing protein [Desulfomonile tiedjei]|uniref:HTH merR-type domain-containing protein n=1 Tax=Desulfomonile tiedjei (strain ATCC 49306 / DSM 6799 / DCB-1) TaxID=706587 RepID=I4C5N7_DESTA|nr:helix-turn-helix domain-containing protein [Desulfomonile tiedjei]AFM24878.1 hypothetical protein Desti_2184 [Desulfomonile tiedjei DSM 6799]
MKYYGINAVAHDLKVHPSSLRRWEEKALIFPDRLQMGKSTLRIYDEEALQVLRLAKEFMDAGMNAKEAFEKANKEEQCHV